MVCLIGASGSGKSTLLRCMNLLEPIDDGAIYLDGEDIPNPASIHSRSAPASASSFSPSTSFPT
jgi:ABC-type polar amino acid transport system ATPase subunit